MGTTIDSIVNSLESVAGRVSPEDRHELRNAIHTMQALKRLMERQGLLEDFPGAATRRTPLNHAH